MFWLCFSRIPNLSGAKFNQEVANKSSNSLWILLFYRPYCKKYKEFYQAVEQTMVLTNESVRYGEINCQGEPFLCKTLGIDSYPTLVFKNRSRTLLYDGVINPQQMAKAIYKMANQRYVKIVDDFWIDDFRDKPTAILFAKKERPPGWFAVAAQDFHRMRCGLCNDEGLWRDYNITITEGPKLVFYDENRTQIYEGMFHLRHVEEAMDAFLSNRVSRVPVHRDFFVNAELPEICYDYTVSCVFSYEDYIDPKLYDIHNHYKKYPFRFFIGTDRLPFPGLEQGNFIIFNAKRNSIDIIKDIGLLQSELDRVMDGTATWTPLPTNQYTSEL